MTNKVTWSELQLPPINLYTMPKMTITNTLEERGKRYGSFLNHANIAQALKRVMWSQPNWGDMAYDQQQALEVIADKIARVLNGDPNYIDNWHDIQGYAKLVEDRLNENNKGGAG